ncbi:MAG: Gfo/Idh/MocA family oxidoreductase [Verrucomicrobiae bacterium]|nr:Gfo/Idh/MocA family oxidoreductase [Verrucomicrobiae bacterium]
MSTTESTPNFRIGVIGCGYWGPNHVRNFNAVSGCTVGAICDTNDMRLAHMAKLYPDVAIFRDMSTMLAEADLDAVVIALPVRLHYSVAKACLEAGKHVLIEKPMASSSAECEELISLSEAKGLTLMVGHTFLYSEPVRRIVEIIKQGDIGELQYINSQRLNLGLFQTDINVAWDLAPHDISIILQVFGASPLTVNCQGNAHITKGIEDVTNISLSFPDARFATVQSSWLEPRKVRQTTFVGSKRMIVYDDLQPLEKVRVYDVRVERPPHYDSFAEFQYSYHYGDSYIPRLKHEEPLKVQSEHFLDCIRTGNSPISDGYQGLELVRILESCSQSLGEGGGPIALAPRIHRNVNDAVGSREKRKPA